MCLYGRPVKYDGRTPRRLPAFTPGGAYLDVWDDALAHPYFYGALRLAQAGRDFFLQDEAFGWLLWLFVRNVAHSATITGLLGGRVPVPFWGMGLGYTNTGLTQARHENSPEKIVLRNSPKRPILGKAGRAFLRFYSLHSLQPVFGLTAIWVLNASEQEHGFTLYLPSRNAFFPNQPEILQTGSIPVRVASSTLLSILFRQESRDLRLLLDHRNRRSQILNKKTQILNDNCGIFFYILGMPRWR